MFSLFWEFSLIYEDPPQKNIKKQDKIKKHPPRKTY